MYRHACIQNVCIYIYIYRRMYMYPFCGCLYFEAGRGARNQCCDASAFPGEGGMLGPGAEEFSSVGFSSKTLRNLKSCSTNLPFQLCRMGNHVL